MKKLLEVMDMFMAWIVPVVQKCIFISKHRVVYIK